MLYLIFCFVNLSLFVYSLGLQTMWEALCEGISRFKLNNDLKNKNKNNLRIYLGRKKH